MDDDPRSLVRAIEELHAARQLWLADERAYAARRRAEKARGHRQPRRNETWRDWQRGWGNIAFSPDPAVHPDGELSAVVDQVLRSSAAPGDTAALTCLVCGGRDDARPWSDGVSRVHQLCRRCGVSLAVERVDAHDPVLAAARTEQWKEIWRTRGVSSRTRVS
ncbi:hypothetical protein ABT009_43090 [Streptomyces sp. NPDC002896]|uniref:hypothetical protein n=1 Tax=Streptomyces sp. NPDC002896 TaxID=3154438 RepID=UPI0033168857